MRIRIAHTQAILLLSAVLLTVLSMGALNAWNLRDGFSNFLASRDDERLEQFAILVSKRAEEKGGIDAMEAQGINLTVLFREFGGGQPRSNFPPPLEIPFLDGRPPPRPAPIASIDAFKERVALYNLSGQPILGAHLPPDTKKITERPIYVNGRKVAILKMAKLKPVPNDVEARFLSTQYQGILMVAAVLLLASLLISKWLGNHWVRPLIEIQKATKLIAQGELNARIMINRDDEIGDATRNINKMAESLQQMDKTRRRLIADISHELRTPLTVLRGEIDALIDGVVPISNHALHSLREEAIQLNSLVDDMHLLAMADLRALPCYFEELDACEFLDNVIKRFEKKADQQGVKLNFERNATSPMLVRWDASRIEQLLSNLLINSLRYTDSPGKIVVSLSSRGKQVLITIEDTPPGVSDYDMLHIFEPLYRADIARGRVNGGSGLGLAICTKIVNSHKGSIIAKHSPLGGLLLNIDLPQLGDA